MTVAECHSATKVGTSKLHRLELYVLKDFLRKSQESRRGIRLPRLRGTAARRVPRGVVGGRLRIASWTSVATDCECVAVVEPKAKPLTAARRTLVGRQSPHPFCQHEEPRASAPGKRCDSYRIARRHARRNLSPVV